MAFASSCSSLRVRLDIWVVIKRTLATGGLLLAASAALAGNSLLDRSVRFEIPAQSLESALLEFSKQAQVAVFLNSTTLDNLTAPSVVGVLPAATALAQLLGDSGLAYETVGDTITVKLKDPNGALRNTARGLRLAQAQPGSRERARQEPLEEIVVTAQKRKERLEDVPISVGVLSAEALNSSTAQGVTEALNAVPGVATTEQYTGGTQVAVRGVAASGSIFNGSSPIAYYLDSMPFGFVRSSFAPDSNAYDLDRVEVLRGPQGTLYGASALNGVVRVLTRDADLSEFQIAGRASFSDTKDGGGNYRGDAAVNVPIVEGKLAARAVLGYQNQEGWIDRATRDDANDAELRSARFKLNGRPTEQLSIGLTTWFSRSDYGAPSISADGRESASQIDEPLAIDYDAYGFNIGYDFSAVSLSSSTSYLEYEHRSTVDWNAFLGLPTALVSELGSEVLSQEILLTSTGTSSWRWSVGGFYRDVEDRTAQGLSFLGPAPVVDFTDTSQSFAIFGEVTSVLLDGRLELTGGLRYFEDDVEVRENLPGSTVSDQHTFDKVSPRAVLAWHPERNTTLYASYSQGFRSGVSQTPNVVTGAPSIRPADADNLTNYELGAKSSLWDGKVGLNAAVFYVDWEDVQQSLTVDVGGLAFAAVVNGESASGLGAEFGFAVEPIDRLQLGLNFSWNDLAMDDEVFSGGVQLFARGDRLNYSPKYTASASTDYRMPLGGGGLQGRLSLAANYLADQSTRSILAGAQHVATSDTLVIGRASFSVESPSQWRAALFVDNFTNEDGAALRQPFGIADWDSRIRPRTVGVQLSYGF